MAWHSCPVPNCLRTDFPRQVHLNTHLRNIHGVPLEHGNAGNLKALRRRQKQQWIAWLVRNGHSRRTKLFFKHFGDEESSEEDTDDEDEDEPTRDEEEDAEELDMAQEAGREALNGPVNEGDDQDTTTADQSSGHTGWERVRQTIWTVDKTGLARRPDPNVNYDDYYLRGKPAMVLNEDGSRSLKKAPKIVVEKRRR